jgi:hypothetical protein
VHLLEPIKRVSENARWNSEAYKTLVQYFVLWSEQARAVLHLDSRLRGRFCFYLRSDYLVTLLISSYGIMIRPYENAPVWNEGFVV